MYFTLPAAKKWSQNVVLIFGQGFIIVASIIKINFTINEPQNQEQYYAGTILCLAANQIIEMAALSVLAQAIPPRLRQGARNAGMFMASASTLGRTIGSLLFTAYSRHDLAKHAFISEVVAAVWTLVFFIATVRFRKQLHPHNELNVHFPNPFMKAVPSLTHK